MSCIYAPQVTLSICFQTLLCFGNGYKECLFFELDLESDEIFLSINLDSGHWKSQKLRLVYLLITKIENGLDI